MDPNHARSNCIESINLDLSRSGKQKASKIIHDTKDQSISLQRRDYLSSDKRSDTSREETNDPGLAPFEEIIREVETINFHEYEIAKLDMPHDDALVIMLDFASTIFSKILVDTGSTVNVISHKTLRSISQPTPVIDHEMIPLNSFEGIRSLGIVPLTIKNYHAELQTRFTVVDHLMPFDAIVGRPWLHQMRTVPKVYHQCLKFLSLARENTTRRSQKQSRACYMTGFRRMPLRGENVSLVCDLTLKDPARDLSSVVALDESSLEKGVNIGNDLPPEVRHDLLSLLKQNMKTFAWSAADMPGIDSSITSHDLNVDPKFKPVKHKRRNLGPERATAVNGEVNKLIKIGSIREVQYPNWLANAFVVKKKKMENGECASISPISTEHAQKIASHYHISTGW